MLNLRSRRSLVLATILSLFIAIVLPSVTFAGQGRGRGGGQDRRSEKGNDGRYGRRDDRGEGNNRRDTRKADKFINGHDARDGRWDGRGPSRNRTLYRSDWYTRYRNSNRNQRRDYILQNQYRNDSLYNNQNYRSANRNQRRDYNRYYQVGNDSLYYNENYRGTYYPEPTRDLLGGILGRILSGFIGQ